VAELVVNQPAAAASVAEARADLLVLGARGTGGLARVLLGSVADGALRLATVPVLVVKEPIYSRCFMLGQSGGGGSLREG
jgi:nucleotide-binding universal stress UspA family protein